MDVLFYSFTLAGHRGGSGCDWLRAMRTERIWGSRWWQIPKQQVTEKKEEMGPRKASRFPVTGCVLKSSEGGVGMEGRAKDIHEAQAMRSLQF